jgi:hypothetical protein
MVPPPQRPPGLDIWGHHGGTQITNPTHAPASPCLKRPEMASLSPADDPDSAREAHGKEGVNGSSPLEGSRFSASLSQKAWELIDPKNLVGAPWGHGAGFSVRGSRQPTFLCAGFQDLISDQRSLAWRVEAEVACETDVPTRLGSPKIDPKRHPAEWHGSRASACGGVRR